MVKSKIMSYFAELLSLEKTIIDRFFMASKDNVLLDISATIQFAEITIWTLSFLSNSGKC